MRSAYNNLILTAYDLSGVEIQNSELEQAQDVTFTSGYPGGRFLDLNFNLPRDVVRAWAVQPYYKIVARNGLKVVWEGRVTIPSINLDENAQGEQVTCTGAWANYLMARSTRKFWADTRIDEAVWLESTAQTGHEKCDRDRDNRIRFTPKAVAWTTNQQDAVRYIVTTGQTIKRITFDYDLQEAAQQWDIVLYETGVGDLWSVSASGTGSLDHTLVTPGVSIYLVFRAKANQTGVSDGTIYGEFSNIVVYTETGSINLTEVAKDIAGYITELSTDTSLIASVSLSLVPFGPDGGGAQPYADMLTTAASYGSSVGSNVPWAVYVGASDESSDGLPPLVVEAQPDLTSYDYAIRVDEPNLSAPFKAEQDISAVRNWIEVEYQDANNQTVVISPLTDATLKSQASIDAYGQRNETLTIQTTDSTIALNYGQAFLGSHKDPQWTVSGGITVKGYIRAKDGSPVPACEILPGKAIKVENWLNDLSGTGLTLLITGTSYNDTDETCQLTVGQSSRLDVWLARALWLISIGTLK